MTRGGGDGTNEGIMAAIFKTWLASFLLYLALTASGHGWERAEVAWGAVAALAVSFAAGRAFGKLIPWRALNPWRWAKMVGYACGPFFCEMAKANVEVALRVLSGNIRPGILRVKTGMTGDAAATTLANSITLTPGTLSVELQGGQGEEKTLFVHALAVPQGEEKKECREARALFWKFDCPGWIRRICG